MFNRQRSHKSSYFAGIALGMVFLLITTACGNVLVGSNNDDDIVSGVELIRKRRADINNEVSIGEISKIRELNVFVRAVRVTDGRNERIAAPITPAGQIYLLADVVMENVGQKKAFIWARQLQKRICSIHAPSMLQAMLSLAKEMQRL